MRRDRLRAAPRREIPLRQPHLGGRGGGQRGEGLHGHVAVVLDAAALTAEPLERREHRHTFSATQPYELVDEPRQRPDGAVRLGQHAVGAQVRIA